MNKHFEDTRYYLRRAAETAAKGLSEEIEVVEGRFRELTGRDADVEPSRIEEIRGELEQLQERAEGEVREAISRAWERLAGGRTEEAEA